ncbi:hypothetical protein [Cloacibacillus evryensis]|uniref:hypothetical protein n=1 Tax=Cloacibacillus evryensis TaxID=508460 RepID=UPI0026716769|nr:hypothetical protein [Cloacibacillus evryensis]
MIISLLAKPFSHIERFAKDFERRFNYVKYTLSGNAYKAWTCTFPVGGHQDIVDSFLKGAKYFPDVKILVNPSRKEIEGSVVYVPSGWKALRDAILLKSAGKIKKLISGPVGDHISDYAGMILNDAIDACVVPCEWYKMKCMKEAEEKKINFGNIKVWPVGVDHEIWSPQNKKTPEDMSKALIYVKGRGALISEQADEVLAKIGKERKMIICGTHTPSEYRNLLEWCDFVVFCGHSETQGLAIAQAWSMNRQTLVYEPECFWEQGLSAAPYLTEHTGKKWRTAHDLSECLRSMVLISPRVWVLANQTNKIAFTNFLKIVDELECV